MVQVTALGIDLGTTYSCVGVWNHGRVEIVANDQGNRTTPSYVAFTETECLIGDGAKYQATVNPRNSIFDAKRLIGRSYDDTTLQQDLKHWPFKIVNNDGRPKIQVEYRGEIKLFAPEEISSMVLTKMKETGEAYLGHTVRDAVITVPAYFNDSQRQATKDAGTLAGLSVLRIINEPTAAALAYGLNRDLKGEKNVLIFDLGGGTFDVSILSICETSLFEVKSTSGDTHLGGEDFDNRLVSHFVKEFNYKFKYDIFDNTRAVRRLRMAAERAKHILSYTTETTIEIDNLYNGVDFLTKITRAKFEELCYDLFQKTLYQVEKALNDANMGKDKIHDIVLVGGSTRIPKVQQLLQNFFNGKTLNYSINPDEAVAYGATVQAALLSGHSNSNIKEVLVVEVAPLSLGIETAGGIMTKVVKRNSRIPCRCTRVFTTFVDYQPAVSIQVFEGERALTRDNNLLGTFDLVDIPLCPRGVPKIKVTFDIDTNGILTVSAKEMSLGSSKIISICKRRSKLSQRDVERMLNEARDFKEDDDRYKENITARHKLEAYVSQLRWIVCDCGDKLSIEDRVRIQMECEICLNWLHVNVLAVKEEYVKKQEVLSSVCSPILAKFGQGQSQGISMDLQ